MFLAAHAAPRRRRRPKLTGAPPATQWRRRTALILGLGPAYLRDLCCSTPGTRGRIYKLVKDKQLSKDDLLYMYVFMTMSHCVIIGLDFGGSSPGERPANNWVCGKVSFSHKIQMRIFENIETTSETETKNIWLGTRQQLAKLDLAAMAVSFPHIAFSVLLMFETWDSH